MATQLEGTVSAAGALGRVRYSHDAMIDALIANPTMSQGELAKAFGYTQAWISRVVNSDAFNRRLAERKTELVDPTLFITLDEKFKAMAAQSLDIIQEKLEASPTFDNAMKALELSTKALGYGARQNNVNVQASFVVALPQKEADSTVWAEMGRQAGLQAGQGSLPMAERVEE